MMRFLLSSWLRHRGRQGLQLTSLLVVAVLAILVGCSGNDPFDPNSLENRLPVVSMA